MTEKKREERSGEERSGEVRSREERLREQRLGEERDLEREIERGGYLLRRRTSAGWQRRAATRAGDEGAGGGENPRSRESASEFAFSYFYEWNSAMTQPNSVELVESTRDTELT